MDSRDSSLKAFLDEYYSTDDVYIKSRLNSNLLYKLSKGNLDPTDTLVDIIKSFEGTPSFALIGICIRSGANLNTYIPTRKDERCHLLPYTVKVLRNNDVDNELVFMVCIMLILSGSTIGYPAYNITPKEKLEYVKTTLDKLNYEVPVEVRQRQDTVKEWLYDNLVFDFNMNEDPSKIEDIFNSLKDQYKSLITVVLNRTDLVPINKLTPNFNHVVICRSTNVAIIYPIKDFKDLTMYENGEITGIQLCIDAGFLEGCEAFFQNGILPTYVSLTRLCLLIKDSSMDIVLLEDCISILKRIIDIGITLDVQHMLILTKGSQRIANEIREHYHKPKWQKLSNLPLDDVPENVKRLAFEMNIDPYSSKKNIYSMIDMYSGIKDTDKIIKSNIERHQMIINATTSNLIDYINSNNEEKKCCNLNYFEKNPLEYSDGLLSFYSDDGRVFCFTSDMYEDLISTKTNPITSKPLPEPYLKQIITQLDIIKKLGIDTNKIRTVGETHKHLNDVDAITHSESDATISTVRFVLQVNGISSEFLEQLQDDNELMLSVLEEIGITISFFDELSPKNKIITFYYVLHDIIKESTSNVNDIVNIILEKQDLGS